MRKSTVFVVASFAALAMARADLVVVDTLPANNQANLTAAAGQTFTTGTLGLDNVLLSIEIEGPQTQPQPTDPLGPFFLQVWTDLDGDFATWDPGTVVATSDAANSTVPGGATLSTWTFNNAAATLSDGTVYAFTYTDPGGGGALVNARMGLTNANGIPDGALFSAGVQPFGGAFDTSFRLNTTVIPEPGTALLLLIGGAGLVARRRPIA